MASQLTNVLDTLGAAIAAAINAAGVPGTQFTNKKGQQVTVAPGNVLKGNTPISEEANILAGGDGFWQVMLWPLKPKPGPIYSPNDPSSISQTPPTVDLTVNKSISGADIIYAFGGLIPAEYNVHVVLDGQYDALTQTTVEQSLSGLATAVAAQITALDIPGVTAVSSGVTVTISGASDAICTIGGTGSVSVEVGRYTCMVQVSIWAADPYTRDLIEAAIETQVGSTLTEFYALPDGAALYVFSSGVVWNDDSQADGSLYLGTMLMDVEYGIMATFPAVQIGATEATETVGAFPSQTSYGA